MTLDLNQSSSTPLFANSLSIVREKAASNHIRLDDGCPRRPGSIQADA
jgi:hypothetical protein